MSFVRDVLYLIALAVAFPVILWRIVTRRKYRGGLSQKLGAVPRREGDRPCVWVHGVSVGEVLQARALVAAFRARHRDWDVVVSTTTDTGLAAARATFPDADVIRYPLDFSFAVARSLDRIRPAIVVLIELEVWPNFVAACGKRDVPVVIANGRLSAGSFNRQKRFGFPLRSTYRRLACVAAQTGEYARRFADAGVDAERINVTGSLKYDAAVTEAPDTEQLRRDVGIADDARVLVAGSTFAGEDEILLDVYAKLKRAFDDLRLIIVPRHPERFDAVAALVRAKGFACVRRSRSIASHENTDAVILGDTMGELVCFYALATVVFVGKSLVAPGGGQNLIEPAALGRAVVFGPYVANFRETRDLLLDEDAAVEVDGRDALARAIAQLLSDKDLVTSMGARAQTVVERSRGATERTLDLVEQVLASGANVW